MTAQICVQIFMVSGLVPPSTCQCVCVILEGNGLVTGHYMAVNSELNDVIRNMLESWQLPSHGGGIILMNI